jgi:predicted flap endonuclease-1-like 5' DNA nuclease
MIYLINALATPITIALLLGITVGWSNVYRETSQTSRSWMAICFLLFAIGCLAASLHLFPGRQGLYLDMTLVLFASYLIGCTAGHLLHKIFPAPFDVDIGVPGSLATASPIAAAPIAAAAIPSTTPVSSGPDDLALIWGVGDKLAVKLNAMGYQRFEQIANWSDEDIAKFESHSPEFRGRVARDQWIEQCRRLAEGWRPSSAVGERLIND